MSPLKYFHLLRCFLLHATPVRNLLRHLHAAQGLVCPFAKLSSRSTAQLCGDKFCRCCHSLQRMTFAGKSAGRTELRKHSLFKRLSAGTWPCREWAAFVSCFFFSTLAHTSLPQTAIDAESINHFKDQLNVHLYNIIRGLNKPLAFSLSPTPH